MKLGFVGAGRIGSTTAFTCIQHLDLDEVVLVDIVEDLAVGEAMDLSHAIVGLDKYAKIVGGSDYSLLKGCDLIVVSAGLARKPGMTRLDLAKKNAEIMRSVAKNIVKHASDSKILVVTNPLDVMTYVMWKETGKDRREVFGMGSLLDTVRLKERIIALGGKPRRIFMMGEHGDSMFCPKSLAEVEGEVDLDRAIEETRGVAMEVIKRKGATFYAPAVCIYRMVKAVLEDTKEEIPTSVVLQGEYGISDVALGVPAILGRDGVERIVEYDLTDEEKAMLMKSAEILKERLKELGY
ncbi:malate dehydrogenase [Archaeoglobus profundus]|uniref:Malate dehydrogenase n=1 Tax=Archaeoglobus profundus (strain DSM 5631 / JCM 9629 / NBRC 100127 / Av18) TaxID=572546 RepID=D2RHB2_ARCPA|nr:malate dehydrogenase [Archaeoglobus profundus]ADB57687.1 Lactate/malate dehydrogenase [Archaeoglobus profundus DSM 5631]